MQLHLGGKETVGGGQNFLVRVAARSPSTLRLLLTADPAPERTVSELMARGVIQAFYQKPRTDNLIAAIRRA